MLHFIICASKIAPNEFYNVCMSSLFTLLPHWVTNKITQLIITRMIVVQHDYIKRAFYLCWFYTTLH